MEKQGDDAFYAAAGELAQNKRDDVFDDGKGSGEFTSEGSQLGEAYEGYLAPTLEEAHTLRHVPDSIMWTTYLIAFVELAERFSFYGSTIVFVNFIQQPLPAGSNTGAGGADGQSGALNQGQQTSTGLTTLNAFWCYVTPLLGAYLADTRWGRFKTIGISVAITLVGHIILVISAIPPVIVHPNGSLAALCIAIVVMGLGTGGFKSNISPLVAEQQKRTRAFVMETSTGERVVVDPSLTTARIYMYFYFFINVGALIGQITMTFAEKYVGFYLAYTLPTAIFLLCPLVLFVGRNRYVRSPPTGSVLGKSFRLWRFAAKGRWSWNPYRTFRNLTAADFWENVKPSNVIARERETGVAKPRWMTFDDVWVDEVRRGFKACAVFLWYPLWWLSYNQIVNNLTSQAATMVTNGVPNDVVNNLDPFALIIFIPIFDLVVYPFFRRIGFNFTPIKKITAGFFTGCLAMIWAAVVQHYIYKRNPCGYHVGTCVDADGNPVTSDLNVWIQTGSYVLIAFSEILASITGLEYAFTKAPKNMRSLVMGVFLFMSALASAIGEAFVSVSEDPLLVWNYGIFAVCAFVGGIGFWLSFRHLDAEEDELNLIQEGSPPASRSAASFGSWVLGRRRCRRVCVGMLYERAVLRCCCYWHAIKYPLFPILFIPPTRSAWLDSTSSVPGARLCTMWCAPIVSLLFRTAHWRLQLQLEFRVRFSLFLFFLSWPFFWLGFRPQSVPVAQSVLHTPTPVPHSKSP
ncbi:PTR2-domain-containing protein [Dentipellis sp. KUC8613]|nr:PTR2-domain-containing protein [Dentipellis sp. KUC8613]